MPLSEDIRSLREGTLADLTAAHDYFMETRFAWYVVNNAIASGQKFWHRNATTGTIATEAELAVKSQGYVSSQLAEATFQQFLATFENFYFDLLRLWLMAYPRSLGRKMVDFKAILDLPDKEAITELVVRKELNEVLYDRPSGWFDYLEEKVNLGCPSADEVGRIAEAKATRDVLVHNRGVANRTYGFKAGSYARFREGERVEVSESYHREIWELTRKVVDDVATAAVAKAS